VRIVIKYAYKRKGGDKKWQNKNFLG
jgi:hypothetical protein